LWLGVARRDERGGGEVSDGGRGYGARVDDVVERL
jgi:hypothetical protein